MAPDVRDVSRVTHCRVHVAVHDELLDAVALTARQHRRPAIGNGALSRRRKRFADRPADDLLFGATQHALQRAVRRNDHRFASTMAMGFSDAANTAQNMLSRSVRGSPTLESDRLHSSAVTTSDLMTCTTVGRNASGVIQAPCQAAVSRCGSF
jgi:hypothetical protein